MRERWSLKTAVVLAAGALAAAGMVAVQSDTASASAPKVLYVGSIPGVSTPTNATYSTIQGAVNAAKPGTTILIAPGDYHENGDASVTSSDSNVGDGNYAAVIVRTKNLIIRGMNRNTVIVDGTSSSASTPCSSAAADQNTLGGLGRNGIVVYKAANVQINNLTVCNFLAGSGNAGNGIWWNGGDGSGQVGMKGYTGSYLTATSTYLSSSESPTACVTCALYGIFVSNTTSGSLDNLYANNQSDSGFYIGACQTECDSTLTNSQAEYNALGYSGTNSGGPMIFKYNTFDNNREGFDTNTQLVGDPPGPQNGTCKGKSTSPITGTNSCWIFEDNVVTNNNNPNAPVAGEAGLGPVGTGLTVTGGRNDTVMNNEFSDNVAWGALFVPFPSSETSNSATGQTCASTGGIDGSSIGISELNCIYDPQGDHMVNNEFYNNGTLGSSADGGDFGNLVTAGGEPTNCFSGNEEYDSTFTTPQGPASDVNANDGDASQTPSTCGTVKHPIDTPTTGLLGGNTDDNFLFAAECDSGLICLTGNPFPQWTGTTLGPVPSDLATMPNPCAGVPANAWCPGGSPTAALKRDHKVSARV